MSLDGLDALESTANRRKVLGKLADLVEKSGIDLDDVGRIEKVRINSYQALTKNNDGEAEIHDLEASSVVLSPKWADGPAWPVVQPAKPVVVRAPSSPRRQRRRHHQAVILPDPQIGFRRFEDGTLDPFHDEEAMAVALRVLGAVDPERVVNLGDFCDLPAWGKYMKEPAFYFTTQATLDRANLFLGQQREAAPNAVDIDLLEGNHDWRMTRGIIENAAEAYGIRVANAPDSWPVMSIPNLLQLDELGVTYHAGYPAGELWLNDQVRCIHGVKVKSGGSTASAVVNDDQVSTIFGHIHRLELQYKTRATRQGPNRIFGASPGCLCRVDGAVPSVKGGTDAFGRPLTTWENWQQGVAIVSWYDDGPSTIELAEIVDGKAWLRGELVA